MPKPYIIAELSGNHNGDINRAFQVIEAAKKAGADAVKLQTYTANTMTIDCDKDDFLIKGGLWAGYKLYDLYQEAQTPWEWHPQLFDYAKKLGITIFSTPFDETAVDFLESLDAPIYKIASFELVHHPLIAYVARLKKPMIMSTGMASLEEISEAVDVALKNGCTDLTLLHCVSEYPAPVENCNLATMVDLKAKFPNCKIGLSDHTMGTTISIAAVALGATVIEKHVTLKRSDGGVDSAFSLEPEELKLLCETTRDAALALGAINYQRSDSERKNMAFRRSIYAVKDIAEGEEFTKENIRIIRPGYGAAPKHFPEILGKKSKNYYQLGAPISN
ncbi:pseudaminic acid synthase [Candidatus Odyssella acanthamoebae]|uniref:N-acetylneuraminate synthase n=1 Tax=Candidatus Odyssella acanthamoebae TaxID=91604 RepID=A0A077AZ75_9PROT|nr:pseudaminic acid synthase [Candidatus Paracaedibacter acanthamoebae]AIK96938.1 N-acetylneuraminate synthase [Candidatus Paracaedibacter acanthamoebae]